MLLRIIAIVFVLLFAGTVFADSEQEAIAAIRATLKENLPEYTPDFIEPSPIPGVYQVGFGTQIVYFSADGRYALQGTVFDLANDKHNVTEDTVAKARRQYMDEVKNMEAIVFSPEKVRHSITVFIDVDCPYCAKLHNEVPKLNSYGVEVKYLMSPILQLHPNALKNAISVWCSANRKEAITKFMSGQKIEPKTCDNPIEEQSLLAQKIGVSGTPAILLHNGTLLPGYQPAKQLVDYLDANDS